MVAHLIDFAINWICWSGMAMFCAWFFRLFIKKEKRKPLKAYIKIATIIGLVISGFGLLGDLFKFGK